MEIPYNLGDSFESRLYSRAGRNSSLLGGDAIGDLFGLVLVHGSGHVGEETDLVLGELLATSIAVGTTEDILVFHLGEVDAIVTMRMGELLGIKSIISPSGVASEVVGMTVSPILDLEIADRFALVVVADGHGSLVGLVVDGLGAQVPLSLLAERLKDVVGANLHDGKLLVEAGLLVLLGRAVLVLADFTVATAGDLRVLQGHELGLLHVRVTHGTVLVTERLTLSITIPLIVILVVSVKLIEGIVEVTVDPGQLRNMTEVEGNLRDLTVGLIVVVLTKRVKLLVSVGVHDLVTPLVVRLGLVDDPLGGRRMIKVEHF